MATVLADIKTTMLFPGDKIRAVAVEDAGVLHSRAIRNNQGLPDGHIDFAQCSKPFEAMY